MRFVCDCCNDLTNIEADRMEIKDDKMLVYNRGWLVYVADLGQIMLAKLTPGREDGNGLRTNRDCAAENGLGYEPSPVQAAAGDHVLGRQGL